MGLVDYSDSDSSEIEKVPQTKSARSKPKDKPAFQKVVDRSNPGKIKVSLPQPPLKNDENGEEPPAKRVKAGGAFTGFNSFLPAPKRTGQSASLSTEGNSNRKGGLGAGVNLKTGAVPGFSRDREFEQQDDVAMSEDGLASTNAGPGLILPPPASSNEEHKPQEEVKLVGKPTMFRPLSVSRKPVKKKKNASAVPNTSAPSTPNAAPSATKKVRAKVSLFSLSPADDSRHIKTAHGEYQPLVYNSEIAAEEEHQDPHSSDPSYDDFTQTTLQNAPPPVVPTPPISQSLDDIAGDLNLSAAERRQLFGRQKAGQSAVSARKVINFNTDEEYMHNEMARAAGEKITHNPVRSIAPGKHSLKQLVNAAQSQKDALEESFAQGKSNRAEASSRYGW